MGHLSEILRQARHDKRLSRDTWEGKVRPALDAEAPGANGDRRLLLDLFADDSVVIDDPGSVRWSLLNRGGYPVPDHRGFGSQIAARIAHNNVSEIDPRLEELLAIVGRPNAQVRLAIVDSFFDMDHPVIAARFEGGKPGRIPEHDHPPGYRGHGTSNAGVVGSGTKRIRCLPYSFGNSVSNNAAFAFGDALGSDACLFNLSFGIDDPKGVEHFVELISMNPDRLFVVAAGNDEGGLGEGDKTADKFLAANDLPNLLQAGAYAADNKRMGHTVWGDLIDLAGPGEALTTCVGGTFGMGSHTSIAASFSSNAAGRVFLIDPDLKPAEVIALLAASGKQIEDWDRRGRAKPILDVDRAMEAAAIGRLMRMGIPRLDAEARVSPR